MCELKLKGILGTCDKTQAYLYEPSICFPCNESSFINMKYKFYSFLIFLFFVYLEKKEVGLFVSTEQILVKDTWHCLLIWWNNFSKLVCVSGTLESISRPWSCSYIPTSKWSPGPQNIDINFRIYLQITNITEDQCYIF